MPPLHGFSDNPFQTRDDLVTAVYALLTPLILYQSPRGARIRLPVGTGAHFDETAAQLEGFARPLWAIGALLASHDKTLPIDERLQGWIRGMAAGADPLSGDREYWGDVADIDQRMVEVEILAYALLAAPEAFLGPPHSVEPEDVRRRGNITRYLDSVNGKKMPLNNWLWFRVMANLALVKSCGIPYEELKESMDNDLKVLDGFYLGDGWASDGPWSEGGRQMDYYSGSFAIQFSQLMYARYAADIDPGRVEVYKERARAFAGDFWRYFDDKGAAIPFGRSLTYRFAQGGFWGAAIMAEVDALPPPLTPGVLKGLLFRHLRYWAQKPDIFYPDGTLNIGYAFPNMFMCEDYNSPQSPYWCMKTFCLLALPETHPFWSCEEEPHPLSLPPISGSGSASDGNEGIKLEVKLLKHPRHILVDSGNHHYLLSSGQYCGWPLKATEAKYAKFAYSSTFGFSVPTGPLIQQIAPDSTLALSQDGGETWQVRWKSQETIFGEASLKLQGRGAEGGKIETLISTWKPSKKSSITVQTTLVPPTKRWPDWHVRVHKITCQPRTSDYELSAVDGGFAIYGRFERGGLALKPLSWSSDNSSESIYATEGVFEDDISAIVVSSAGASGIRVIGEPVKGAKGVILKPDSNTNLLVQRSLIPTIQTSVIRLYDVAGKDERDVIVATAVFAVSNGKLSADEIRKRWFDHPKLAIGGTGGNVEVDHIHL